MDLNESSRMGPHNGHNTVYVLRPNGPIWEVITLNIENDTLLKLSDGFC